MLFATAGETPFVLIFTTCQKILVALEVLLSWFTNTRNLFKGKRAKSEHQELSNLLNIISGAFPSQLVLWALQLECNVSQVRVLS